MILTLLTGILTGLMVAAPVGPIDMLCLRRSLLCGARSGFITGMGAACADAIYGAVAAYGLITVTSLLMTHRMALQLIGGIFLFCWGLKSFLKKKEVDVVPIVSSKTSTAFMATFLLALLSPMTILSFLGSYAVIGVGFDGMTQDAAFWLTLGVFVGSSLWWLILSSSAALFKHRLSVSSLYWINWISGAVLMSFGLLTLLLLAYNY